MFKFAIDCYEGRLASLKDAQAKEQIRISRQILKSSSFEKDFDHVENFLTVLFSFASQRGLPSQLAAAAGGTLQHMLSLFEDKALPASSPTEALENFKRKLRKSHFIYSPSATETPDPKAKPIIDRMTVLGTTVRDFTENDNQLLKDLLRLSPALPDDADFADVKYESDDARASAQLERIDKYDLPRAQIFFLKEAIAQSKRCNLRAFFYDMLADFLLKTGKKILFDENTSLNIRIESVDQSTEKIIVLEKRVLYFRVMLPGDDNQIISRKDDFPLFGLYQTQKLYFHLELNTWVYDFGPCYADAYCNVGFDLLQELAGHSIFSVEEGLAREEMFKKMTQELDIAIKSSLYPEDPLKNIRLEPGSTSGMPDYLDKTWTKMWQYQPGSPIMGSPKTTTKEAGMFEPILAIARAKLDTTLKTELDEFERDHSDVFERDEVGTIVQFIELLESKLPLEGGSSDIHAAINAIIDSYYDCDVKQPAFKQLSDKIGAFKQTLQESLFIFSPEQGGLKDLPDSETPRFYLLPAPHLVKRTIGENMKAIYEQAGKDFTRGMKVPSDLKMPDIHSLRMDKEKFGERLHNFPSAPKIQMLYAMLIIMQRLKDLHKTPDLCFINQAQGLFGLLKHMLQEQHQFKIIENDKTGRIRFRTKLSFVENKTTNQVTIVLYTKLPIYSYTMMKKMDDGFIGFDDAIQTRATIDSTILQPWFIFSQKQEIYYHQTLGWCFTQDPALLIPCNKKAFDLLESFCETKLHPAPAEQEMPAWKNEQLFFHYRDGIEREERMRKKITSPFFHKIADEEKAGPQAEPAPKSLRPGEQPKA